MGSGHPGSHNNTTEDAHGKGLLELKVKKGFF